MGKIFINRFSGTLNLNFLIFSRIIVIEIVSTKFQYLQLLHLLYSIQ